MANNRSQSSVPPQDAQQMYPPFNEPDVDVIRSFLENQSKELELKGREADFKQQQDRNSFQFARETLQAQKEDREKERVAESARLKLLLIFWGAIAVVLCGFFGYALYLGKEQFLTEVLKIILYGGTGSLGGYSWGRYRKQGVRSSTSNQRDSYSDKNP